MNLNKRLIFLLFVLVFVIPFDINAQFRGIPPEMVGEYENMSPEEQRRLAQQYGIDIEAAGDLEDFNELGDQADPIVPEVNQRLIQRQTLEKEFNDRQIEIAEEEKRSIFERDYEEAMTLPIYGQFLFDEEVTTYAVVDDAPVPDDYRLGVGDSLNILLYGSENFERELIIDRNGDINFPKLGNLSIAGMTYSEVKEYINRRVAEEMIGVTVSISMGRLRSINVFMAGEAKIPGRYSVSALSTVSQMLFVAGGPSEIGSLRDIQVLESGKRRSTFDVYKLLTEGNTSGDVRLKSGDVVFIPPSKKVVMIDGAVRRPGRYELIENETIDDLILLAGGLDNRAYLKKALLERYNPNDDFPLAVNLDLSDDQSNYLLQDGDVLRIASVKNIAGNSILLKGAVQHPGKYAWIEEIRLTDIVTSFDQDLIEETDTLRSLIIRRISNNNQHIEVIGFNLLEAITNPKSELDPLLQIHDEILIFAKVEEGEEVVEVEEVGEEINVFAEIDELEVSKNSRSEILIPILMKLRQQAREDEPIQIVSISGGVKSPGSYPLTKNATFFSLIKLAGGYTDDAYVDNVELRRIDLTADGSAVVELSDIRLGEALSSSFLMSRDHLRVRRIRDWNIKDMVEITGEIYFPGEYLISPGETLSSVIERAGGFTSESFIEAGLFTRENIKVKEREQLLLLGDTIRRDQAARSMTMENVDTPISSSSEEVEAGITALLATEAVGRLIIDLPRLLSGDVTADIILKNGDVLDIPMVSNAVTVVGEVRRTGSFIRQESYTLDDYIELSAGITERGNKKGIYVIRANGSVDRLRNNKSRLLRFSDTNDNILAGDTIVVPIRSSYQSPLALYRGVTEVVFQGLMSIAAFGTLIN